MNWVHPPSVSFWLEDPGFKYQLDALENLYPILHGDLQEWMLQWIDRPWVSFEAAGHVSFVMGSFNSSYSSCTISAVNGEVVIASIATSNVLAPIRFLTPKLPDAPFVPPYYPPTEPADLP